MGELLETHTFQYGPRYFLTRYLVRTLALLHIIELIHRLDEREKMNSKPNSHTNVKYLMRMTPSIEISGIP